jgi:hypothetical protein
VDSNQASYDPLQYPLIFPTEQRGWEYNMIKLQLESTDKRVEDKVDSYIEGYLDSRYVMTEPDEQENDLPFAELNEGELNLHLANENEPELINKGISKFN